MQNICNKSLPLRHKKSIAFEGIDFLYRSWFDTDFRILPLKPESLFSNKPLFNNSTIQQLNKDVARNVSTDSPKNQIQFFE